MKKVCKLCKKTETTGRIFPIRKINIRKDGLSEVIYRQCCDSCFDHFTKLYKEGKEANIKVKNIHKPDQFHVQHRDRSNNFIETQSRWKKEHERRLQFEKKEWIKEYDESSKFSKKKLMDYESTLSNIIKQTEKQYLCFIHLIEKLHKKELIIFKKVQIDYDKLLKEKTNYDKWRKNQIIKNEKITKAIYRANNKESIIRQNRKDKQRDRLLLRDRYIKSIISSRSKLKFNEIPDELVKAHREILKVKRVLTQKRVNHGIE